MNNYNRRSIRLPDYDYSAAGDYYLTICIQNRECLLGRIVDEQMELNAYGLLVDQFWQDLPKHYAGLELGASVVMPNHFHGILILTDAVSAAGTIYESSLPETRDQRRKMLLSKIIGRFKMTTGKQINLCRETPGAAVWQRNYFEHIIRNQASYNNIEHYILNNPMNWQNDQEFIGMNQESPVNKNYLY